MCYNVNKETQGRDGSVDRFPKQGKLHFIMSAKQRKTLQILLNYMSQKATWGTFNDRIEAGGIYLI